MKKNSTGKSKNEHKKKKKKSAVKGMDLQRDTNEKVLKRQKILGGIWCLFFFVLLRSRKVRNALPRALIFFLV